MKLGKSPTYSQYSKTHILWGVPLWAVVMGLIISVLLDSGNAIAYANRPLDKLWLPIGTRVAYHGKRVQFLSGYPIRPNITTEWEEEFQVTSLMYGTGLYSWNGSEPEFCLLSNFAGPTVPNGTTHESRWYLGAMRQVVKQNLCLGYIAFNYYEVVTGLLLERIYYDAAIEQQFIITEINTPLPVAGWYVGLIAGVFIEIILGIGVIILKLHRLI